MTSFVAAQNRCLLGVSSVFVEEVILNMKPLLKLITAQSADDGIPGSKPKASK